MKRKDSKGRVLRPGEYERQDGRYVYQYKDIKGMVNYVYSWRLVEPDPQLKGKQRCESLRELEKNIAKDLMDGIESRSKVTLNERWDDYIGDKPELKQSTRTNYKYMYDKYVRKDIGSMRIKDINYSTMKKFFNKLIHEYGFKPNSIEVIHTILHPTFDVAVRDNLIRTNPTAGIVTELKKGNYWEYEKRHSLTKPQQMAFVEFAKTYYHRWYSLLVCLLGTGCRIGEMLGLRWQDIKWKENIISVNHNLIYRLQDDGRVIFRVTTTKTRNGNREIPMFRSVRSALKEEYIRQEREGFCLEEVDGYSGFIWMNKDKSLLSPACFNRALERMRLSFNEQEATKAKKENREPMLIPHFSAHHLRHTFCTRLCEEETDLKLIQEIMGHADISTTMDVYNESNIERKKERFAALEKTCSAF